MSIEKKCNKFKAGFRTNWEDFSFDGCSSSQSEDVKKKKITITFTHKKKPIVKSQVEKKKTSRRTVPLFQETPLLMIEGSVSRLHSPVKVQEFVQESVQELPTPPVQEPVCTPPISTTLFSSPLPTSSGSALAVSAPLATLVSLVLRIK